MFKINYIPSFLFFLLLNNFAFTQDAEVYKDSIKKYLYSNFKKASTYNSSFLKLSKENSNNENISLSYSIFAVLQDVKGDLDSTIYYYDKALDYTEAVSRKIDIKNTIANTYQEYSFNAKALQYYTQSLELAKKEGLTKKVLEIENYIKALKSKITPSLSNLLYLKKKYEKELIEDPNFKIAFTRRDLARAYLNNNNLEKAITLIKEGLYDAKSKNNIEFLYNFSILEIIYYLKVGNLDLAYKTNTEALYNAKQLNNLKFIDEANYYLAQINFKEKKPDLSIEILNIILESSSSKTQQKLLDYYTLMAESYSMTGKDSLANDYYKKIVSVNEKIIEKEKVTIDNIHDLNLKEVNLKEQKQRKVKQFWIIAFVILLLLGLVLIFWFIQKQRKTKTLFNTLLLKEKEANKHYLDIDNVLKDLSHETVVQEKKHILNKDQEVKHTINKDKVIQILKKLKTLENEKYYLKQECNLHNMAIELETNTSYLSKIINTQLDKTFSIYINELRINYAISELKRNKKLRAYSALAIAKELGYKNTDSFTKYFKEATGITPSVYIRKIKNKINS